MFSQFLFNNQWEVHNQIKQWDVHTARRKTWECRKKRTTLNNASLIDCAGLYQRPHLTFKNTESVCLRGSSASVRDGGRMGRLSHPAQTLHQPGLHHSHESLQCYREDRKRKKRQVSRRSAIWFLWDRREEKTDLRLSSSNTLMFWIFTFDWRLAADSDRSVNQNLHQRRKTKSLHVPQVKKHIAHFSIVNTHFQSHRDIWSCNISPVANQFTPNHTQPKKEPEKHISLQNATTRIFNILPFIRQNAGKHLPGLLYFNYI